MMMSFANISNCYFKYMEVVTERIDSKTPVPSYQYAVEAHILHHTEIIRASLIIYVSHQAVVYAQEEELQMLRMI